MKENLTFSYDLSKEDKNRKYKSLIVWFFGLSGSGKSTLCNSVEKALFRIKNYLNQNNLKIPVYIEVRNSEELREVVKHDWIDRIILDNMSPNETKESVSYINGRFLIESSGNINEKNIVEYAETGVDFVSMGSITYSALIIDMSVIQE